MSLSPHDLMIRRLCDSFERGQVPSIDELLEPHRSKVKQVKAEIAADVYETDEKIDVAADRLLDDVAPTWDCRCGHENGARAANCKMCRGWRESHEVKSPLPESEIERMASTDTENG